MSRVNSEQMYEDLTERYAMLLMLVQAQEKEVALAIQNGELMVDNHANGRITNPTVKALDATNKTLRGLAETLHRMNGGEPISVDPTTVERVLDPLNFSSADRTNTAND